MCRVKFSFCQGKAYGAIGRTVKYGWVRKERKREKTKYSVKECMTSQSLNKTLSSPPALCRGETSWSVLSTEAKTCGKVSEYASFALAISIRLPCCKKISLCRRAVNNVLFTPTFGHILLLFVYIISLVKQIDKQYHTVCSFTDTQIAGHSRKKKICNFCTGCFNNLCFFCSYRFQRNMYNSLLNASSKQTGNLPRDCQQVPFEDVVV